jgi:hypothetical protein
LDPTDHLFYESLVRDGEVITAAAMASDAYDHIEQARRDSQRPESRLVKTR